jgi:hypothetical protein
MVAKELKAARKHLQSKLACYPTPISGCDAQFNHLLAERSRVDSAIVALEEPIRISTPRAP